MNQHPPLPPREAASSSTIGTGVGNMIELKIALMAVMIAILLFAVYFTAMPG
jgi:hypothetical protein